MELILETGLTHQQKAVDSIADAFRNTSISQPNQFFSNPDISPDGILFGNKKSPATIRLQGILYLFGSVYFTESMCAIKSNTLFE